MSLREHIVVAVAAGMSEQMIARLVGVAVDELRDQFAHELEHGAAIANARVVANLEKQARRGNRDAQDFLLNCQPRSAPPPRRQ